MIALLAIVAYLAGSIPFGVVVSRLLGTVDPRTAGSRNVGFTNVLRVGGKRAGILTLVGDMGKGWLAAWAAGQLLQDEPAVFLVALAAIVGHLHSAFLGFKGGKGVATALGVVLGVHPLLGASLIGLWLLAVAVWRYSSGGALVAFAAFPVLAAWSGQSGWGVAFACVVSGLIWLRHKDNLKRLWSGTESRIGQARKS